MPFIETGIAGLLIYETRKFNDDRGCFFEAYNAMEFSSAGLHYRFVQDNQSHSRYGVIRGLHYQQVPHAQCKLVRAVQGKILDVAVDLRKSSPTFGRHFSIELSQENNRQLLIPQGFAHGFSVLSPEAVVLYKCDAFYNKESEAGILFNDPRLAIDWKLPADVIVVSEKDKKLPVFEQCDNNFE